MITSPEVTDQLLRRGEVDVAGDPVIARQVANQISLQRVVQTYSVRRIFTFHRSIASAKSFTSPTAEGIGSHLVDFQTYHVNGAMPTAERERIMTAFREAERALISNARCLTEGVDVPAVDVVAFLAPKRSRVDIVQATGRAMRRSEGKSTGYVLIPLFVQQAAGESVEEAIQRTEFDEVWDVLQAMLEQDEGLAEVIRQMREDRGRRRGFDDQFGGRVDIQGPDSVTLEALRQAVATRCIDQLGSPWDESFGELAAFQAEHGHCNVPAQWNQNRSLSHWVANQRTSRRKGRLRDDRIRRLQGIGFEWRLKERGTWEDRFSKLLGFKSAHGHCDVPPSYDHGKLLVWVRWQRVRRKRNQLSEDEIRRLDEAGFVWNPHEAGWETMFCALAAYAKARGHCTVPLGWDENPGLHDWVNTQRSRKKRGKLAGEKARRLESLGLVWSMDIDDKWTRRYSELLEFKDKLGHCRVPVLHPENPDLAKWAVVQRRRRRDGKLSEARIRSLESVGFDWGPGKQPTIRRSWRESLEALRAFSDSNGHCNVPHDSQESRALYSWTRNQRRLRAQGKLSDEQIRELDEIGFPWDSK